MTEEQETRGSAFPMRLAGEGERVRIVELRGGKGFHNRLAGLGLTINTEVEIVRNTGGKIIIAHEGARLFLGGGMAQKIHVVLI